MVIQEWLGLGVYPRLLGARNLPAFCSKLFGVSYYTMIERIITGIKKAVTIFSHPGNRFSVALFGTTHVTSILYSQ